VTPFGVGTGSTRQLKLESGDADPLQVSLYSVSAQGSVHVTAAPSGVAMLPSSPTVDPEGTSQNWKTVCDLHPEADASLNVSAAAGTEHAGMS
jgi:hypothetical protein